MVCCIISTLLAIAIQRGSIYTIKLKRRGIDLSGGMEQNILQQLKVKNHMSSILSTINEGATLNLIMDMFKKNNVSYLHMVDAGGHLTGIISFRDIRPILDEEIPPSLIIARDIATLKVKTITPEDTIQAALRLMSSKGISQLPVIKDKDSRILVGCLREKNVISAYDNEVIQREMR